MAARTSKVAKALVLCSLTAGALTATNLGSAPAANATCASFFGIGNSADCTSTLTTIAIAIGTNAVANATGILGAAIALGTGASAQSQDVLTVATAAGTNALAIAQGNIGIATQIGANGSAATYGVSDAANWGVNFALNVTPGATEVGTAVQAGGLGNAAVNLFGYGTVTDQLQVNSIGFPGAVAVNIGGTSNNVNAQGLLGGLAVNLGGSGNSLQGVGPFGTAITIGGSGNNVAGAVGGLGVSAFGNGNGVGAAVLGFGASILQNNAKILAEKGQININGFAIPASAAGAATKTAARSNKSSPAAAATVAKSDRSGVSSSSAARATRHGND